MTQESERENISLKESLRRQAREIARSVQKLLRIRPKNFVLVSGAPRTGTTAVATWLRDSRGVAGFMESRILVAVHRFIEQVRRFENLQYIQDDLMAMTRGLVYRYYADRAVFFRKSVLLDKEPLEPVAFPDKRYSAFLNNARAMLPEAKFLLMVRDPISVVSSMSHRKWGYSLTDTEPQAFALEEHIETWRMATKTVLEYVDDPDTYICQFGQLVSEPEQESKRICGFLGIPLSEPFQPHATSSVELTAFEKELILSRSEPQLEALAARGISHLQ